MQALFARGEVLAVAQPAYVEVVSALARRRREGRLTAAQTAKAVERLDADWKLLSIVTFSDELAISAARLLLAHTLRAADAVQLAAATQARARAVGGFRFLCADRQLVAAARRLGLEIEEPA